MPSSPLTGQTEEPRSKCSPPLLFLSAPPGSPILNMSPIPSAFPLSSAPHSSSRLSNPTAAHPSPHHSSRIHIKRLYTEQTEPFGYQLKLPEQTSLDPFPSQASLTILHPGLRLDPLLWPKCPAHLFASDLTRDQQRPRVPGLSSPDTEFRVHTSKGSKETSTPLQQHLRQPAPKATVTIQAAWGPTPPSLVILAPVQPTGCNA